MSMITGASSMTQSDSAYSTWLASSGADGPQRRTNSRNMTSRDFPFAPYLSLPDCIGIIG